ncbi:Uncharacterised protein [Mycobacteroides abscessus subsp. abscessus]|nr:Uncharacterised protein [Mycobacteroides abscessus subsp. abscessus]
MVATTILAAVPVSVTRTSGWAANTASAAAMTASSDRCSIARNSGGRGVSSNSTLCSRGLSR